MRLLLGALLIVGALACSKGEGKKEPAEGGEVTYPREVMPGIVQTAEMAYTIVKADWATWVESPSNLIRGVKVASKDGGYALEAIEEGVLAAGLGFLAGDVVTHIGDTALNNPLAVMKAVGSLAEAARLEIKLLRGGQSRTHIYTIK